MFHKIKEAVSNISQWYIQPEVQSMLCDIKHSVGASFTFNTLVAWAVPQLAHLAFVLFSGGVSTIAFYFLNRYLKKNHP